MEDEVAFLRAIMDAPGDHAPRLVYADWLDEHGQPDRAEFIRLLSQTGDPAALARLREVIPLFDPKWAAYVRPDCPAVSPGLMILREVARGGMSTVYEATHTHPDLRSLRLALRILNDRQSARRFLNSCRIHGALGDGLPVPPLYEVATTANAVYAVGMFIDGDDLLNNIRGRTITPADLVRIVTTVATALDEIHRRGVLHGSVHPRHLLQDQDGRVWVIGFGEMPTPGLVMGNPVHLAIEQFDRGAGDVGPATDVYQLAETAAWLLGGQHPYQDYRPPDELLAAKRADDGWRSGSLRDLPGPVAAVFRRALDPDPAARHPTAGEFAAALAGAFRERPR